MDWQHLNQCLTPSFMVKKQENEEGMPGLRIFRVY